MIQFLVFVLGFVVSTSAMAADTYNCSDSSLENPIGINYSLSIDETKINGNDAFTYNLEILRKDGSLQEKASGVGGVSEVYENGQVMLKKYLLADNSELIFLTKDSKIRFIKRLTSGSTGSYTDCTLKP